MNRTILNYNKEFFKELWRLIKPYWISEERNSAISLFILLCICILIDIVGNIGFNNFHRDFYNALQNLDKQGIISAIVYFCFVFILYSVSVTSADFFARTLSIRWRRWLSNNYINKWLGNYKYYHMQVLQFDLDNPDQRISEDLDNLPTMTLSLFRRFVHSALLLITFSFILWNLSSNVIFHIGQTQIIIPGFFCIIALICAVIGTWLMNKIGKNLSFMDVEQQKYNADYRFRLIRLRESSEQIALHSGEVNENLRLQKSFKNIYTNFMNINLMKAFLNFFNRIYGYIYYIVSFALSLPLYLAKTIQLGAVTQISSAFNSVASGLSFIVEAYIELANWRSVVFRIAEFDSAINHLDKLQVEKINHIKNEENSIVIENLQLHLPNGNRINDEINLKIEKGKALLIQGPAGIGKSTLVRAIAGIWPFGQGLIKIPKNTRTLFLPQKSYFPIGSLKESLLYPDFININDEQLISILNAIGLSKFINRLHESRNWSHELSLGEQQLIACARIFVQQPEIIFMDESTSAMDELCESKIHFLIKEYFPTTTLVTVAHRSHLCSFYDATFKLHHFQIKKSINTFIV